MPAAFAAGAHAVTWGMASTSSLARPSDPFMKAYATPAAAIRLKSSASPMFCQRERSTPRIREPGPTAAKFNGATTAVD